MSIVLARSLRDDHNERTTGAPQSNHGLGRVLAAIGPVIYAVITPDGIKIGHTTNLANRLRTLSVEIADLLGFMRGTVEDEQAIHAALVQHRVRGREWYAIHPDVVAVVNDMRRDLGLPTV